MFFFCKNIVVHTKEKLIDKYLLLFKIGLNDFCIRYSTNEFEELVAFRKCRNLRGSTLKKDKPI